MNNKATRNPATPSDTIYMYKDIFPHTKKEMENITIVTKDGDNLTMPKDVAKINRLFESIIEEGYDGELQIPAPMVATKDMAKVIEFCIYYDANPFPPIRKPIQSKFENIVEDTWYNHFLSISRNDLFDLIMAANYLDNQPLLDIACTKVATIIKGKSPTEIREFLSLENDLSQQEEADAKNYHSWRQFV